MAYNKIIVSHYEFPYVFTQSVNGEIVLQDAQRPQRDYAIEKIGSAVKDWKYKTRRGISATSDYQLWGHKVLIARPGISSVSGRDIPPPNAVNPVINTYLWDESGYPFIPPAYLTHLPTERNVDSDALSKLLSRIRDDQTSFTGLTFLGELREAVAMIRKPGAAIRQGLDKYFKDLDKISKIRGRKSRSNKNKRSTSDAIAGSWLEASFGWTPLLSDAGNAAETALRILANSTRITRAQGYAEDANATVSFSPASNPGKPSSCATQQVVTTKVSCKYVAGLRHSSIADAGSLGRMIELCGFNPSEFIPTLYELTPWSFLVDYFTNLGDIISAGCTDTSSVSWLSKSNKLVTTSTQVSCPNGLDPDTGWVPAGVDASAVQQPATLQVVRFDVVRTTPTSLGVPDLQVKSPFGSAVKSGNILALINQQISNISKRFR